MGVGFSLETGVPRRIVYVNGSGYNLDDFYRWPLQDGYGLYDIDYGGPLILGLGGIVPGRRYRTVVVPRRPVQLVGGGGRVTFGGHFGPGAGYGGRGGRRRL